MRPDEEIYNSPKWVKQRRACQRRREWFKGTPLGQYLDQRDRATGEKMRMFPLGINLIELGVGLHRDLARGILDGDERLVVTTVIERGDDPELAEKLETLINKGVWIPNHGGPMQQLALLSAYIYGGTAFQLAWEPWNADLPYRLAVRHIADPSEIFPLTDYRNPWRMLECYVGYEIDPKVAKLKYGVTPDDKHKPVLYLEHWTPEAYKVTVDGQVPQIKKGDGESEPLAGENPWGFVPIYYVPADRSVDFFGDSGVDKQEDITLEFNGRATNISDLVRSTRPGQLWGSDINRSPKALPVKDANGAIAAYVLDLGNTRAHPNANAPKVFPTPMENLPDAVMEFPQTLLDYWMMVARISPAMLGLDDTQSGRITGPAVGNRMWTSVAQALTTRVNFTDAKCMLDRDIIAILKEREKAGAFEELGIEAPDFSAAEKFFGIKQQWSPMLLMDRTEEHQMLIDALREGGASIERFLIEKGVEDVQGEKQRIMEWLEYLAELEAKKKPVPEKGQQEDGGSED